MSDLKPCPFCGGKAKYVDGYKDGRYIYFILCENCNCQTLETDGSCVELWNTRTPDPLLKQMAEALEEIVNEVKKCAYHPSLEHMRPSVLDAQEILQAYREQTK